MRRIKSNERKDLGHVTVFITDQDKEKTVLVFEKGRKDSKLKFPGGGIEEGETPEQAAIRETWEETGLELIPEKIKVVSQMYNDKNNSYKHFFRAEVTDFSKLIDVGNDYEIPHIVDIEDLFSVDLLEQHFKLLFAYFQIITEPICTRSV